MSDHFPSIPIHFSYISEEPEHDREFDALCFAVPGKGDLLFPASGRKGFTVVERICHRFTAGMSPGDPFLQVTTVILRDPTPEESAEFPGTK